MNDRQLQFIITGAIIGGVWGLIASLRKAASSPKSPAPKPSHGGVWSKSGTIHGCAERGDTAGVEAQLSAGAAKDSQDQFGCTPLHLAAFKGYLPVVSTFLAAGANVKARDKSAETALHKAAAGNHKEIVSALLSAGAEVDAKDRNGGTPLHQAAGCGSTDTIPILLDAGANKNAMFNEDSITPLHLAAVGGKDKAVALLLAAGVNATIKSRQGKTALDLAKMKGHLSTITLLNDCANKKAT